MKIFFRYLFLRLLVPFAITLFSCTIIWVMADLYGNLDDFLTHKTHFGLIVSYYALALPSMLEQVLPAALLFSTLWTLLSLNRRNELVALQTGGMAPLMILSPFLVFGFILVGLYFYLLSGPVAESKVARDRLIRVVKNQSTDSNTFENLPYVDNVNRRVWFFQRLNIKDGKATGVEILQRDTLGHDLWKCFAQEGVWSEGSWKLRGVVEITYSADGSSSNQGSYAEKDLDVTTPPAQFSLIISQPDQLTLSQLSEYIRTSTSSKEHLLSFRTEWWYRVLHPLSLVVLLVFALAQGIRSVGRRSAVAGVVSAIIVLLLYTMALNFSLAFGRYGRLPPVLAVLAPQLLFGAFALNLFALRSGWWWQIRQMLRPKRAEAELLRTEPTGEL